MPNPAEFISKKVSIVMPAFNAEACVKKSIESVLAQTYRNLEIILVDDGSTDGTAAIVKSSGDPRIKYFYQKNKGLSGARNAGFGLSSGDYVVFLDSDDLLEPECLGKTVSFLEKNPEYRAVYFNFFIFYYSDPGKRLLYSTPTPAGNLFPRLLSGTWINMSRIVFNRDAIKDFEFDENLKGSEDWDFLLRVSRYFHFGYIDDVLIGIGKTGFSYSSGRKGRLIASGSAVQVLDKLASALKKTGEERLFPAGTHFKYKLRNAIDEWANRHRHNARGSLRGARPRSFKESITWCAIWILVHLPCHLSFVIDWYYAAKQSLIFKKE